MTECDLCGYKIHIYRPLDQSVIVLKNEINQKNEINKNDPKLHTEFSFNNNEYLCSECVQQLYKSLKKQKEYETLINTHYMKLLEQTTNISTNTLTNTSIIELLKKENQDLQNINNDLDQKITNLVIKKEKLYYKKRILLEYNNYYWKLRNDIEFNHQK